MNACVICKIPQLELIDIETPGHGTVGVCADCLGQLVDDEIGALERAEERHCAGCTNYVGNACVYPGMTWRECA